MKKYILLLLIICSLSCATWRRFRKLKDTKTITTTENVRKGGSLAPVINADYRLEKDINRLRVFSTELQNMAGEMAGIQKSVGLKKRGYFAADEHDRIENLLFRYLAYRSSLWDMVDFYKEYQDLFTNPQLQVKGFILGFNAALHLAFYSSKLVSTFMDEPLVIEKLNEEYYRSRIPGGSYDSLYASITNLEHIKAIEAAWILFTNELGDTATILYNLERNDPVYRGLIKQVRSLHQGTQINIQNIIKHDALLLPKTESMLNHSDIAELAREYFKEWKHNLIASRALLYKSVSRAKMGDDHLVTFTPDQVSQVLSRLKPGDIILTYTAGFMSNYFLPGMFKHGIVYVGPAEARKETGLVPENLAYLTAGQRERVLENLETDTLPTGQQFDIIESVAEGVIINSLEHLLHTHINRLLVLRPRVSPEDIVRQLATAFSLVGNAYDFSFDCSDGSRACCTEVIYYALHGKGPISFPLVKRMGAQTISADDIAQYHLKGNPEAFEFVLYIEEAPDSPSHSAGIYTGDTGKVLLAKLMASAE